MMIVQPANKSLIVRNISGDPLDLSSASDIVRGNASQPSNGELLYLFTSPTEVSVNGGSSVSVTTDGSTYNSDVGGKGVDVIFKSGRASGDTLHVEVLDAVGRKDTYLQAFPADRNYGSCTILRIGGNFTARRRGLIRFNIPSGSVQRFINVRDSNIWVYGSKRRTDPTRTFEFYEIMPENADWVEGNHCDQGAGTSGESTWDRKIRDTNLPNFGIGWAGNQGCTVSGIDFVADRLASVSVSGQTDQWYAYADDSGRLNSFIGRMVKPGITNPGMVSQISSNLGEFFDFFSGNYTTDITLRPKMVFVYEETSVTVIKRAKKGLGGLLSLTLGDISRIAKSEIPLLSNISEVYRSANRVIGKVNSLFPGVMGTELAFTRKTVNTTESLTFASANPDTIVTTTDLSASALPGRVAYIFGTAYNDGFYYIGSVSTTTITLVGVSKLIAETVSATIAIYDVQAHEILPETNTILTHTTSTMTDSGLNDFERMGVREDDIAILVGSARNDGAYSIASSKGLEITLQSDESLTAVGPSYGRIRIIRPSLAYQFDTENNELKLPDYVKEIVKVFENDEELTARSFEYTNNSNNSSELAFSTKERSKIRFPSGIGDSADDEIRVKVKKDIIEFLYPDSISAIEIPASMEEVIIAGTLSLILSKPQYRDDVSFKFNNDIYLEGLEQMVDLEIEHSPPAVAKIDYDYFPATS